MNKLLLATALSTMTFTASILAENTKSSDVFPILAWNMFTEHCPGDKQKQLEMMKECGFNVAGFLRIEELPLAEKAGLKAIVFDPRGHRYDWTKVDENEARANAASLVAQVKDMPTVYGYYVCDEPSKDQLLGVALVSKIIEELDPNRLAYVNMLPNVADGTSIGPSYPAFLKKFAEAANPKMMSVDNYTLMANKEAEDVTVTDDFYLNMQQMQDITKQRGIHFASVMMAMPHWDFAEPTMGNMARQIYVSLAYGARSISYFCYFTNDSVNARLGPIDIHGDKTATWNIVRHLNKDITALGPTLNKLSIQRNYFLGRVPKGAKAPPEDAWIKKIGADPVEAPDVLVGEFRHDDGSRYMMLVNTNPKKSVYFHYEVPGAKKLLHVSPQTGGLKDQITRYVMMAPGMGLLIKIEE